ncbi:TorF family putative porin [Azohydromonas caseinilytica]|nr:TorF family putative porin [Azohydromonas caseinilytica]
MTSLSTFVGAALAGVFMLNAGAQAQQAENQDTAAAWTTSGSVALISQYLFRGISQTQGKPTVQASVDFSHASGWYAGLWGSGVSHAAYNNGSGSEIDLYGGYRQELGGGYVADLGIFSYWFPGAYYAVDGRRIKYDTQELKLGLSKGSVSAAASYAISKRFAGLAFDPFTGREASTRGSTYLELNWNPELAPGWVLNLHAGRQDVHELGDYSFTDLRLGLTRTIGPWQLSLSASHHNGHAEKDGVPLWTFFDADGRGRNVVGTQWLASVSHSF